MGGVPPPHCPRAQPRAGCRWAGPLQRELGQQPEAASGWLLGLALLKARAVNSALLKKSNKGEKERKEKGEWGGGAQSGGWGRLG